MKDVVERLGQWLWKNCPAYLDKLAPGATDEAISACEKLLGVAFPDGMRELYRWRNGVAEGEVAPVIGRYDLMSLDHVVSTQKLMNELLEQGDFKTKNWWRKTWVPIFDKGTGDHICWDPRGSFSGENGQVLEFWHADHDRKILAPSFDGYLTAYVESLEAGVWTFSEDEGLEDNGMFEDALSAKFPNYPFNAIDMNGKRPRPPTPPPPLIDAADGRPIKIYAVSTTFEVGDAVRHPQFGTGVVQAVEQTKVTIAFPDERRTMVHARGAVDRLERPKAIDHTRREPPKF